MNPRPGSQLCPVFLRPGGGHRGKRNKRFCSLLLRAGGGHEGERNNGAGGVEKGSKGLTVVEYLLGLAVGSLAVECPVNGVSLAVVSLC